MENEYLLMIPQPDATVSASTIDTITGMQTGITASLGQLIPSAAVLLISVMVVFFVIAKFTRLGGWMADNYYDWRSGPDKFH